MIRIRVSNRVRVSVRIMAKVRVIICKVSITVPPCMLILV